MEKLTIILLKCELGVQLEESRGKSIGLPAQEVVTFAKAMTEHPDVAKVIIGTSLASGKKQTKWGDKLELMDFSTNFIKDYPGETTHVIFWNGFIFHPGGQPNNFVMTNYIRFQEAAHCHRYVLNTDNRLFFENLEYTIAKRKWVQNYAPTSRLNPYHYINTVTHFVQSADLAEYATLLASKNSQQVIQGPWKDTVFLPLYLLPMFTHDMPYNDTPEHDLIFTSQTFGFMKAYRINLLKKYFTGLHDQGFKTVLIGKQGNKLVPNAAETYIEYVKYHELKKVLNNSMAQLILSEKEYETCSLFPNRIAEGVASNVVNFIHHTVDPDKCMFPYNDLKEFLYIKSQDELSEKLMRLKNEPELRYRICKLQQQYFAGGQQKELLTNSVVDELKYNMYKQELEKCNCDVNYFTKNYVNLL